MHLQHTWSSSAAATDLWPISAHALVLCSFFDAELSPYTLRACAWRDLADMAHAQTKSSNDTSDCCNGGLSARTLQSNNRWRALCDDLRFWHIACSHAETIAAHGI